VPFKRTAGVAGVLFVVLMLAALLLAADAPDPDAPSDVVARYYVRDAGPAKAASTLSALALVPFAVFIAGLLTAVRAAERDQGEGWSVVGVIGVGVTATAVLVSSAVNAALAIGAASLRTAPAMTGSLYRLNTLMLLGLVALGFALTAGGFSIAGSRTRALPPSLCSLGIIAALFGVLGGILSVESVQGSALGSIAFIAFLMFMVWSLLLAISMIRRHSPAMEDQPAIATDDADLALTHPG
jgi:hypothetical protein